MTFFENLQNQTTSISIFSTFQKKNLAVFPKNQRLAKIWQFYRRLCDQFLDFLRIAGIYQNWFTDLWESGSYIGMVFRTMVICTFENHWISASISHSHPTLLKTGSSLTLLFLAGISLKVVLYDNLDHNFHVDFSTEQ